MKKTIILLFYVCLFTFCLQSQWVQLPAFPVSGSAYSVAFINKDTGYVSMDTPALLRTTNGGQSWVVAGNYRIFQLQFADNLYGYGRGNLNGNGRIYKTTNGGFNWDSVSISSVAYTGMFFVNRDTGWIGGYDGTFTRMRLTTNGGVTLQLQASFVGAGFSKIFFLKQKINNEYYGWWVADPSLLRTTNSGMNWNIIYTRTGLCASIEDFYFSDTANGVIIRGNRCLQTTTNGGFNWNIVGEWNVGSGSHIGMANQNTGWITTGQDTIIKTTNFFQTYGKQFHPSLGGGLSLFLILFLRGQLISNLTELPTAEATLYL